MREQRNQCLLSYYLFALASSFGFSEYILGMNPWSFVWRGHALPLIQPWVSVCQLVKFFFFFCVVIRKAL